MKDVDDDQSLPLPIVTREKTPAPPFEHFENNEFDTLDLGDQDDSPPPLPASPSEEATSAGEPQAPISPTAAETSQHEANLQQYHIRFQATNQPWRAGMPDDVQELHDLTCSDFTSSDFCIKDFDDIADFKEIGAGAFACVYRAVWGGPSGQGG